MKEYKKDLFKSFLKVFVISTVIGVSGPKKMCHFIVNHPVHENDQ